MLTSTLKGIWLGFSIAAPVGPIGVLVLRQALRWGPWAGLASGLGAALADLIYGCLAVVGVRLAAGSGRMVAVGGGVALLWLAWRSWRQAPPKAGAGDVRAVGWNGTATTFLLTLSNPMTILSFAALVASTSADAPMHFVGGVFLGSLLWWVILSHAAAWLRHLVDIRVTVLNRLSAVTLACFGAWAIWRYAWG